MIKLITAKLAPIAKQQWELCLLLTSLHFVLVWGFDSPVQKALCICHYGFFLLWQPVWRTQQKISLLSLMLFITAGAVFIAFFNWWLMAVWLSLLFALLGGRVFTTQAKSARIGYLLAAGYLLTMLLAWVIPRLFVDYSELKPAEDLFSHLMPLVTIGILFTRVDAEEGLHPPVLDFFYTLLLFFSAIILVLGSYAIQASGMSYAMMILKVLFGTAITLLVFSWFWNPRSGFSGIGQLVSRYLLSIGLPFEKWVKSIAELAEIKTSAKEFTLSAMHEMIKLPWVSGVKWNAIESDGFIGEPTRYESKLGFNDFHLSLYTHWPLTPAMTMHVKLLTQVLGEFCEAKRREEALSQHIYMQAVYETGSRLTHDIKNLVQSMSGLCSAAEQTTEENNDQLLALIRRQLPLLNQRMARTLEKLEAPRVEKNRRLKLTTWWKSLKQNHTQNDIQFIAAEMPNVDIDPDLLDSVTDNLLQNAIEKRKMQREISIEVTIGDGADFLIEVRDTGEAIPKETAKQLFKKQINSQNGLGIGLYHASKQAIKSGYTLRLVENIQGDVRFRLSRTNLESFDNS